MNQQYILNVDVILSVIKTLKEMDVRGFDSMNRLVGLVMLFENILNSQPQQGEPVEAEQTEKE